jgi:hypothetical protein
MQFQPSTWSTTGKDFSRVKPIVARQRPAHHGAVRNLVAGWAACRVSLDQIPILRGQPGVLKGAAPPVSLLKHADEQTVVGLEAVSRAIHDHGLESTAFTQWGVIASPRFLGRAALALALARYGAEGAWGISPHLIPHRSLHALSGTVSQALKIHGPNYGVGGGSDGAAEALMAASALLASRELPGVWVILTGFDPELVPPDPLDANAAAPVTDCVAVALALMPPERGQRGVCLTVGAVDADTPGRPEFSLENLADALGRGESAMQWGLRCGGWAVWEYMEAEAEMCL